MCIADLHPLRPLCDQCRLHNEECRWSETKKRGPAKDYLRSVQDRLQEIERLLLGLLPRVSDNDLLHVLEHDAANNHPGPSHQTWTTSLSGQDYWAQHAMNNLDSIRAWEQERQPGSAVIPEPSGLGPSTAVELRSEMQSPANLHSHRTMHRMSLPPRERGQYYSACSAVYPKSEHWPSSDISHAPTQKRRYSEETREAGEALFSISNHVRNVSQQSQSYSQPHSPSPLQALGPNQPPETATILRSAVNYTNLDKDFPKHLFW